MELRLLCIFQPWAFESLCILLHPPIFQQPECFQPPHFLTPTKPTSDFGSVTALLCVQTPQVTQLNMEHSGKQQEHCSCGNIVMVETVGTITEAGGGVAMLPVWPCGLTLAFTGIFKSTCCHTCHTKGITLFVH